LSVTSPDTGHNGGSMAASTHPVTQGSAVLPLSACGTVADVQQVADGLSGRCRAHGGGGVLHCKKYPYIYGYFVESFPYF